MVWLPPDPFQSLWPSLQRLCLPPSHIPTASAPAPDHPCSHKCPLSNYWPLHTVLAHSSTLQRMFERVRVFGLDQPMCLTNHAVTSVQDSLWGTSYGCNPQLYSTVAFFRQPTQESNPLPLSQGRVIDRTTLSSAYIVFYNWGTMVPGLHHNCRTENWSKTWDDKCSSE